MTKRTGTTQGIEGTRLSFWHHKTPRRQPRGAGWAPRHWNTFRADNRDALRKWLKDAASHMEVK